jgi:Smr domain-containing protein
VQVPIAPAGRVVAIRRAGGGTEHTSDVSLERGPLTVLLVIQGLPIDELPAGTRLRLGATAVIELATGASTDRVGKRTPTWEAGVLEAETTRVVAGAVWDPGSVGPGDEVSIEVVSVPVTDVLDLHSFRPEETQQVVTAYLVEARRARLGEVRIVHGRGRGAQRAAIRRVLADAPGVAEFSDAPPTRGGWGATIVRLRPVEAVPAE